MNAKTKTSDAERAETLRRGYADLAEKQQLLEAREEAREKQVAEATEILNKRQRAIEESWKLIAEKQKLIDEDREALGRLLKRARQNAVHVTVRVGGDE